MITDPVSFLSVLFRPLAVPVSAFLPVVPASGERICGNERDTLLVFPFEILLVRLHGVEVKRRVLFVTVRDVGTMPRRVSSASSSLHAMASGPSGGAASSGQRGPRPAKSANCIAPASPSPDSSSDNASDNSDLFQWTTSGVERHLARSDSSPSGTVSRLPSAGQSGTLTASRKRKLLEQFLLPETVPGAAPAGSSNTISLSDMRTMGLVGQSRPSASIQPTSGPAVSAPASARSSVAPTVGQMSFSSAYVPSFSFYQSRSFGPPSCSGGGSTESLCSSTADSACGHAPDLPDDGNLATPAPPLDVSAAFVSSTAPRLVQFSRLGQGRPDVQRTPGTSRSIDATRMSKRAPLLTCPALLIAALSDATLF